MTHTVDMALNCEVSLAPEIVMISWIYTISHGYDGKAPTAGGPESEELRISWKEK